MNKLPVSILLLAILALSGAPKTGAERKPLPRLMVAKIEHDPTGTNIRLNPKTRQPEEYKFDGKIVYDEKTGNFLLQWNGMDGRRKTIVYEPATRLDAVIAAAAEYDANVHSYRYSYVLKNLPNSQRKLQAFYLETQAPLENVKAPDAGWYSVPFTDFLREQYRVPGGWVWSDTKYRRVGLLPGEQATGFSFQSSGLPAVVKCYVRHYAAMKGVGEELPEELNAAIHRVRWKIPQGVTVGPAAPPERVDPLAFLRKIREMTDVSLQQGWIESAPVAQEMKRLLEDATAAVGQRDTTRASAILRTLLERVEQEKQHALLSDAYALLKFNLEFLLKHLRD